MMERNALAPGDVVSCIFTMTDDLERRVPGRRRARDRLRARAAAVRARDRRARLDAARDPRADPLPRRATSRSRHLARHVLPRRRRAALRTDLPGELRLAPRRRRSSALRHNDARGDRVLRAHHSASRPTRRPAATRCRRRSRGSPPTSRPYPPLPERARGDRRARCATLNRYPDPTNALLRRRAVRALRRAGLADRDRQRLLRHPARRRRGAARARRRARLRVAVVLGLPAPERGVRRARDHACRSTSADAPRPRRRCCARSPSPRGW